MGLILLCFCIGFIGAVLIWKIRGGLTTDTIGMCCFTTGGIFLIIFIIIIMGTHATIPAQKIALSEKYTQLNYEYDQCVREGVTDELNKVLVAHDINEWNTNFQKYTYWHNNPWTNWFYPDVYAGLGMFEYPIGYHE